MSISQFKLPTFNCGGFGPHGRGCPLSARGWAPRMAAVAIAVISACTTTAEPASDAPTSSPVDSCTIGGTINGDRLVLTQRYGCSSPYAMRAYLDAEYFLGPYDTIPIGTHAQTVSCEDDTLSTSFAPPPAPPAPIYITASLASIAGPPLYIRCDALLPIVGAP